MPESILLVDDEPSNLLALEAILEPLGQRLVRATSGKEALKQALKHDFAVVLLDVQMPEIDGFETAELLRKRPRTRDVPIIFLTAISKDRKFVARGYDVGAVDYLFKPYEPDVLRAKVTVFIELAKKNAVIKAQHETLRTMSERELADFKRRSEQRYADLADSMPQVVWTADASGRVLYTNRRWEELASPRGTDNGEAAPFDAVVHPQDLPRFLEQWRAGVARGEEWEGELRFGNEAAGYRVHLVRALPRRDAEGHVVSWIGTSTEIDRRARAERALRMLAEVSRRLGAGLDDPDELQLIVRDALPVIGDAAMLELGEANEERKRISASIDPSHASLLSDPRFDIGPSTVTYSGRPLVHANVERELAEMRADRSTDGLHLFAELGVAAHMCLPLVSRGRVIGTLTAVRLRKDAYYTEDDVEVAEDLARRVAVAVDNARLQEQNEKRRLELEEANRSKDVFLATLSHELRTPLNAIVGWTDMMRTGQVTGEEAARAIETVDRNAHALSNLVADLLDVSRIVTGTLKIDSKLVSLASVVEAAIEAARPASAAKRVNLDVSIERVGCVNGDAGRLKQIFGNLLSNAIKFTPAGGTVFVKVSREDGRGRILVKDTGEGIAPDFLPQVFERFKQAEKARAKGLGLGLAIVKHLVEEHGGAVTAASEGLGSGASFTVDLPIAAEETLRAEEEARSAQPASGPPELVGIHALVVEDDPDGNELITTILERYGARVTSVGTAAAALDALAAERPDVLVSDIGLPDADGMELIRSVRGMPELQGLPAIALTAYASRQDAAKAVAAGFDAHVAKPVQPATLGTAVARLLSRRAAELKSQPAA